MAHTHGDHVHEKGSKHIGIALFLNALFTVIELVGAFFTGSMALMANAIHDIGDTISLALAWYLERVASRKSDKVFTYGYGRFSLLGALITGLVLLSGGVIVLVEAIPRLWDNELPDYQVMLWIALIGTVINILALLRVKKSHGHNAKLISWHLIEDVLGWVAVIFVALVLRFYPWPWLDPLVSILITLFVSFNVIRHLRSTLRIFLQGLPFPVRDDKLKNALLQLEHIDNVEDIHCWSMDGDELILTAELVLSNNADKVEATKILDAAHKIAEDQGIFHATFEVRWGKTEASCNYA